MRVVDPKFHIRLSPRTPDKLVGLAADCVLDGCTSIVFVNNDAQVSMLRQNGKSSDDAEDYVLIGCYEPAVMGKELNCSGAGGLNLAKPVESLLSAGSEYLTFDSLFSAYIARLDSELALVMDKIRRWEKLWPAVNPSALFSGPMDSCHERGLDVSEAGAAYNTSGVCCSGLADAVDSLAVIQRLVYEEKHCSLAELRAALAADWSGREELRAMAVHRVPKWGNNDDRVDRLAVEIADFLGERINSEPNARGGVFQAALYGIIVAARNFGLKTGALPNGRRAGEPLTMNTGASPGRDKNGATSLINSVTKIDLAQFPNGTVLDIMLHPSVMRGSGGVSTLAAIVRSHFARGGMAIQFNIFDSEVLREARAHPAKYANLQVRLCGWNVRFVDLDPCEQEMFIVKSEIG